MKKHLDGLAEWDTPQAGMFFWFKLLLNPNDPDDEGDSEDVIRNKALENGVLALPGTAFLPDGRKTAYCRASFSLVSEEDINEGLKRLRSIVLQARSEI
jgi:tryptophan aminotransferase